VGQTHFCKRKQDRFIKLSMYKSYGVPLLYKKSEYVRKLYNLNVYILRADSELLTLEKGLQVLLQLFPRWQVKNHRQLVPHFLTPSMKCPCSLKIPILESILA
jgi:hypothetical protein